MSPTHSLGAPEAVCQAWAPQGTADRKPFPHPSSIACQGPRRSSRLCPGGRCSLLTASPCSWTPLNLSYPFFHSRCPCMVQAPGPLACATVMQGVAPGVRPSGVCYNIPAAPRAPGQEPTRTPHSNLSQGRMSPPRCCPSQGPVREQSRDRSTRPEKKPVLRSGQPQFPHLSAVSRSLPSAMTEGSQPPSLQATVSGPGHRPAPCEGLGGRGGPCLEPPHQPSPRQLQAFQCLLASPPSPGAAGSRQRLQGICPI